MHLYLYIYTHIYIYICTFIAGNICRNHGLAPNVQGSCKFPFNECWEDKSRCVYPYFKVTTQNCLPLSPVLVAKWPSRWRIFSMFFLVPNYDVNLDDFEGWKGYDPFCHKPQEISTCFASAMLVSEIHEISKWCVELYLRHPQSISIIRPFRSYVIDDLRFCRSEHENLPCFFLEFQNVYGLSFTSQPLLSSICFI